MTRIFCLALLIVFLEKEVYSYECGVSEHEAENGGYIKSPNFPGAYPDGPYNCTYIITNGNGGGVKLELTDYTPHYIYDYNYHCREEFFIYERDENGTHHFLEGYCPTYIPTTFKSRTSTLVVRLEIKHSNLYKMPFFKARYSGLTNEEDMNTGSPGYIDNYPREPYHGSRLRFRPGRTGNSTRGDIRVIKAAPGHRLSFAIGPFHEETGDMYLELRDGMTSESPLIQSWRSIPPMTPVFTQSEFLYFSLTMNETQHVPYSYVSFITESGPCPTGYYKCASNDMCIGESAVCDGYNHCGDNSDEVHSSFNCSTFVYCVNPSPCYNDAFSCDIYYPNKIYCSCRNGYQGDRCEYKVEGCTFSCLHGGECKEYACECELGRFGDYCELQYECDPPCRNGGTCSFHNDCSCRSGFYGQLCEQDINAGNNSGTNYLGIILPAIILVVIMVSIGTWCMCSVRKKRRGGQATRVPTDVPMEDRDNDKPSA